MYTTYRPYEIPSADITYTGKKYFNVFDDAKNAAGQWIAGAGGIISNVVGQDVRLGGGQGLGAKVAGQSQPYYSTNTNNAYNQGTAQSNPYSAYKPGVTTGTSATQLQGAIQSSTPIGTKQTTTGGAPGGGTPPPAEFSVRGYNVGDRVTGPDGRIYQVIDPANNKYELQGGSGGGGAPQFDQAAYDNQLNASYAPAFQQADDVEAQYRAEYPTSQEFINNSYAEALTPIQNQLQTQLAGLDTQAAKGKTEEKNQIAKARQKYNDLRQGGLTRFGGASSVGEAYGELLGRATSQEMGGINQNFSQHQMDIEKERANVNNFFADKKTNLEKEKQNKLQELKNSFDDEIRKINSQRAALESEKSAKRMAAIQEFSVQARQIQYEAQVFKQKLDAWKAAKDEAVQLATQFGAKSFSTPSMPGVMGGFNVTGQNQGTGGDATTWWIPNAEQEKWLTNAQLEAKGATKTGVSYGRMGDNTKDPYGLNFE